MNGINYDWRRLKVRIGAYSKSLGTRSSHFPRSGNLIRLRRHEINTLKFHELLSDMVHVGELTRGYPGSPFPS